MTMKRGIVRTSLVLLGPMCQKIVKKNIRRWNDMDGHGKDTPFSIDWRDYSHL